MPDGAAITTQSDLIERVIAAARSCKGTPWKHGGRMPGPRGRLDCVGLLLFCADQVGVAYDDYVYAAPDAAKLRAALQKHLVEIPISEIGPGHVAHIRMPLHGVGGRGVDQHVAIIAGDDDGGLTLIHSYQSVERVVEQRLTPQWRKRIVGLYRIPDGEGG